MPLTSNAVDPADYDIAKEHDRFQQLLSELRTISRILHIGFNISDDLDAIRAAEDVHNDSSLTIA